MAYIYKITDTRNGMCYVGQTNGNNKYYHTGSKVINRIVKKYGNGHIPKFIKKEIIVGGNFNQVLLNELERHYIRLYNTKRPYGYNLTDGGDDCGFCSAKKRRKDIVKFIHVSGEVFIGTIYEFSLKCDFKQAAIRSVVNGYKKSIRKWYLNELPKEKVDHGIEEIANDYLNNLKSISMLALQLNSSESKIRRRLVRHGVKLRGFGCAVGISNAHRAAIKRGNGYNI